MVGGESSINKNIMITKAGSDGAGFADGVRVRKIMSTGVGVEGHLPSRFKKVIGGG